MARGAADRHELIVSVHDVAPPFEPELRHIVDRVTDLVDGAFSLAVVPSWHGRWPLGDHPRFCAWMERTGAELLLHGWTHVTPLPHRMSSRCVGGADELAGLAADEAHARVERGQAVARAVFGRTLPGFVPPAWRMGGLGLGRLAASGLRYTVELGRLRRTSDGGRARLATWSWDAGPIRGTGRVAEWIGRLSSWRAGAIPCLVLHPRDVQRGHLPRALARIRSLLDAGMRPTRLGDIAARLGPLS